jgi:sulfotransferase family protein
MKLIGAGFGRTGTLSMKVALEQLGYGPCYHMTEVFEHPDRIALFRAAAAGEPVDWDAVFAGYESTVDWPGVSFWRELVARYPDAKVLLTVRDPERWYASVRSTIHPAAHPDSPELRALAAAMPGIAEGRELTDLLIWEREFSGRGDDPEYVKRVFTEHNAAVRREVPADRLLVYRVGDGWEPLCAFLGVPVPDEPFPHLNDGDSFRRRIAGRVQQARASGTA